MRAIRAFGLRRIRALNSKTLLANPKLQFLSKFQFSFHQESNIKMDFESAPSPSIMQEDYLHSVIESSEEILNLDSNSFELLTREFIDSYYFPEKAENLESRFILILKNRFKEQPIEKIEEKASDLVYSMKIILNFLDKANRGFLLGDFTAKTINSVRASVSRVIGDYKFFNADKRLKIMKGVFDNICKVAFHRDLKLPERGIPFPERENPRNLFERQLILEDESSQIAIEKFMNIFEDLQNLDMSYNLQFAKNYIVEWFPNLCKAVKQEQEECLLDDFGGDRNFYGKYLLKISAEKIALIALSELMKAILKSTSNKRESDFFYASADKEFSYYIISKLLFEAIGRSINAQLLSDYENEVAKDELGQEINTNSKLKEKLKSQMNLKVGIPKEIQYKIGSLLVFLLKETIKVRNNVGMMAPLVAPSYIKVPTKKYQQIGVLVIEESFIVKIVEKIEKTDSLFIQLERSLPMIYPPAEWEDPEIGGYYQRPTNVMRMHESKLQEESVKVGNLSKVYHLLDILGKTEWRINKRVLNVVEDLWERGGGVCEIPTRHYENKDYVYSYQLKETKDWKERTKMVRKLQDQRDTHSLRCDFTLKLNVAKAFSNVEKIYFPQNMDFRGRIYPVPPHLNHIGADLSRGLLEFSKGKRLGKNGLRWLKIHLANKMGKDKLSIEDRLQFIDSIMPVVEACAKDPLEYREWTEYEDAWQTLAAIFELSSALSMENPEDYISHIHVHQDGSCNGMQHYAALGKDVEGAKQVNLVYREKPSDLYTHVAGMVQERIANDAKDPNSKNHQIALKLNNNVKRKIVKQTVMTSVYGVTFIGARKQIYKQLKDKEFMDRDENEAYSASYYMALLTLECIKDLFSGAHETKKWLIKCAALIATKGQPVSWITPLGLPVVQPYRSKRQFDVISTVIQKITVSIDSDSLPINKAKQQSAFPPNYIHSLDSTHMMYTAIECFKEGMVFAAVHDSYWTHAADVDRMNKILREQFVRLHSEPLLENLKASFERRFPDIKFPEIPERGNLDLSEVNKSIYFFA